jgi:hypothetical protein
VNLGGRPELDYWLSLDMAKELAMLERSDAGRAARKYFLECERRLREAVSNVGARTEALPEPELRLTDEEQRVYEKFRGLLDDTEGLSSFNVLSVLSYLVLPAMLEHVVEANGVKDGADAKGDLRGYGPLLVFLMASAAAEVRPRDVAKLMRERKLSPRLIADVSKMAREVVFGFEAGRMVEKTAKLLDRWGVR